MSSAEQYARRHGLNIRDALVFLVDWRVSMLRKDAAIDIAEDICARSGASSLLSIILRCIADIMKTKIVARNKDAIAVVAFGVRGSHTRQGWPGVRVLRPLKQADAGGIRQMQGIARRLEMGDADALLDMSADEVRASEVDEEDRDFCFGPDEPVQFDKALWAVRHHYTAVAAGKGGVLHRKRVFVFTNDEDPTRGNRAVRQLCLTQVKDLADLGASLDVSLLMRPSDFADTEVDEAGLDGGVFFNELVYRDDGNEEDDRGTVMIATVYSFDDMLMRVRKKESTKRAIRKTVLILGNDYRIGVALYALVKKALRPAKVELDASTNKPVFKITTTTCESSGEVLKPVDVRHTFLPEFLKNSRYEVPGLPREDGEGEPRVRKKLSPVFGFKKSELIEAKAMGRVGIFIYGFRSESALRAEYTLAEPQFVFPDESQYTGSTKAFGALLKCMLHRKVVGIASVRLSEKSGTGMRFAALVPQQEIESENDEPGVPGGLHLFYLPYKDDIYTAWRNEMKKEVKEEDEPVVKQEEVETAELNREPESVSWARRMVRSMKIPKYSPHLFLNPDLQRFYAGLENAAGVESRYNPQDELLCPDAKAMQQRGGEFASEVKRLEVGIDFDGDAVAEEFGTLGNKRAAAAAEAAVRRKSEKRAARDEAATDCNDEMYTRSYHDGTLSKLLKADLQLYCRAHGLREKGTKKELVILIEDNIRDKLGNQTTT